MVNFVFYKIMYGPFIIIIIIIIIIVITIFLGLLYKRKLNVAPGDGSSDPVEPPSKKKRMSCPKDEYLVTQF